MKCPECNLQRLQGGATKPIKEGCLLKYKKRVFGKDWKESWVVLYEDSTMAWYKNKDKREMPDGTVMVNEAPEMLAVGQYTVRVPKTPALPPGATRYQLLAFGSKTTNKVHWLLAASEHEVNDWMTAISNTLPPAPIKRSKSEAMEVRLKNGQITICDNHDLNTGNLCASMKPVLKKCRDCCVSCEQQRRQHTSCHLRERCAYATKKDTSCGCDGDTVDLVTGFLLGDALSNSSCGWRSWGGWGEGIGWKRAAAAAAAAALASDATDYHHFADNADYASLPASTAHSHLGHDLGDVDYENGANTLAGVSAGTHEAAAVIDSTAAESAAGILSFDFLL